MAVLLEEGIKNQIRDVFKGLTNPVEIHFYGSSTQLCEYCEDTRQLLEEVAELSDLIEVKNFDLDLDKEMARSDRVNKAPGFVILSRYGTQLDDFGVRYAGIPAGHEFTSLINDILMVSKRDSGLSQETRTALSKLQKPVHLQVFVTPTCPYCPRAVILAHQMAMESPFVEAEMVEAMEFSELADKYHVSGVPHTVVNDGAADVVGAVPESNLLDTIQKALKKA